MAEQKEQKEQGSGTDGATAKKDRKSHVSDIIFIVAFIALIVFAVLAVMTSDNRAVNVISGGSTESLIHKVTVQGEGTVTYVPDQADFDIDISVQRKTSREAYAYARASLKTVKRLLKKSGVKDENIKTNEAYTSPNIDYDYSDDDADGSIKSYTSCIILTISDISVKSAEEALTEISKIEKPKKISITTSDVTTHASEKKEKEIREKTLSDAMKDAKEQADTLAKSSGMRIEKVLNVSVYDSDNTSGTDYNYKANDREGTVYDNTDRITSSIQSNTTTLATNAGSVGGSDDSDDAAPVISTGEKETYDTVKVTYIME